jgi:multiple sugar transport system ATP-binding protein
VAKVVFENIYKSYPPRRPGEEGTSVLRRINLDIADGEFLVLVGPSGCGKSTLLRMLAGLEEVTGGDIYIGDRRINDLPPKDRDIAMVFQSYALYPHLSVYDNLAFGLRRSAAAQAATWQKRLVADLTRQLPKALRPQGPQEAAIADRIALVAQMLQIDSFLDRLPKQLSGGQKQRVALGRAIARNPQVFLMDEPLSNLDAKLRTETRAQIVGLQRQLATTTIYVTHDQVEAMTMGQRIAVMNGGQIQQIATPLELYNRPANRFVAQFIGSPPMNFITVKYKAPALIVQGDFRMTLPENWAAALTRFDGLELTLGVRPEHLSLSGAATKNLPIEVDQVEALGSETFVLGRIKGSLLGCPGLESPVQVRVGADAIVRPGDIVWLALNLDRLHFFRTDTEEAIEIPAVVG